jgi:hypothetical protein
MQRTVEHIDRSGEVERSAELRGDAQRLADRRGTVVANHDVEGFGGHEIERQVGRIVGEASRERSGDTGMREVGGDQAVQGSNEPMTVFGRKIEPELLDGDEAAGVGLVGPEHGTERAGADLVQHAKRSEGVWGRGAGGVRVQCGYSSRDGGRW